MNYTGHRYFNEVIVPLLKKWYRGRHRRWWKFVRYHVWDRGVSLRFKAFFDGMTFKKVKNALYPKSRMKGFRPEVKSAEAQIFMTRKTA